MKIKVWGILLILSLGFNLAVVATFGHRWLARKGLLKCSKESSWHQRKMQKALNLTGEQAKLLEKDREQLRAAIAPVKDELKKKRAEFIAALDADSVDQGKIDALAKDIAGLRMKIEKSVIEHSIMFKKNLTAEQQAKYKEFLQKGFRKIPHRCGPARQYKSSK